MQGHDNVKRYCLAIVCFLSWLTWCGADVADAQHVDATYRVDLAGVNLGEFSFNRHFR
jgi:hypothetical protein